MTVDGLLERAVRLDEMIHELTGSWEGPPPCPVEIEAAIDELRRARDRLCMEYGRCRVLQKRVPRTARAA